jgi:guanylate kinase
VAKDIILENREEFKAVLEGYEISKHGKEIIHDVRYVVLLGVAAGGRNTIIDQLVRGGKFVQLVSDTTRPPKLRDGKMEQEGVNYYFRDEEEFLKELKAGEFLEAELIHDQQVSGTSIRELKRIYDSGKIGINETEFGGGQNLLKAKPDSDVFAIFPPSYDEWQRRFQSREDISSTEFINRMNTALKIIALCKREDRIHVIINDDFIAAASSIDDIIHGHKETAHEKHAIDALLNSFEQNISKALEETR